MPPPRTSLSPWFSWAAIALLYLLISVVYAHPLPWRLDGIDHAGDPGLNASILEWNSRTLPFSKAWWNAPQYFPTEGVASFTESMVGFSPFASPVVWLTGSQVIAYNVALFLTWPLSAFAAHALVWYLTRRHDASFIAGFALAFSPYRMYELGHAQTLATQWMPLILLSMHAYLNDRKQRWLWLFAVSWILNSLSNGHYMLFVAVLVGVWLAYFGSTTKSWRPAVVIGIVFTAATLPLVPVFVKYQAIHDYFNLHRAESEIIFYSAQPNSWARVSYNIWFWSKFLPEGKDSFFPGVTLLILIAAGCAAVLWHRRNRSASSRSRRILRALLVAVLVYSVAASLAAFVLGSFEWVIGEFRLFKLTELNRAVTGLTISLVGLAAMTPSVRRALQGRSPFVFYTVGIFLFAILACGPMLRVGEEVILSPLPYRWLMSLPGFMELRVPARIWMLSVVCLSTAGGLAYAHLRPAGPSLRRAALVATVALLVLDCWIPSLPVEAAPESRPVVESPDRPFPLLDLPIGFPNDYPATFRTGQHHRRVVNGVSGYNPPYYLGMVEGLQRLDPLTLEAVASYSPLDVVITVADDPGGRIRRYVASFPGATQIAADDKYVAFHVTPARSEPTLGSPLPIVSVKVRGQKEFVNQVHDGNMETGWGETPQTPDQFVVVDLGETREVGGVSLAIGDYYLDFPRHIAVDLSVDGSSWTLVWDSPTMGPMMWAWVREPRKADMRIPFPGQNARFVRIRQTESHFRMWRISELDVHAPPR